MLRKVIILKISVQVRQQLSISALPLSITRQQLATLNSNMERLLDPHSIELDLLLHLVQNRMERDNHLKLGFKTSSYAVGGLLSLKVQLTQALVQCVAPSFILM